MDLLKELLEYDQAQGAPGDPEQAQAVADIQRRFSRDPARAQLEIERWKKERMRRVDPRTRALLQQKERMTQQIDKQIDRQRQAQSPASQ